MVTKDIFVLCPHGHRMSITLKESDVGKAIDVSCNCLIGKSPMTFKVTISPKAFGRKSASKVKYWGEK